MGFDTQLKRFFPLLLCALIAVVAYFQASGISDLLGSVVGLSPSAKQLSPAGRGARAKRPSGRSILERNAFDSVTGPLTGVAAGPDDDVSDDDTGEDSPPSAVQEGDPWLDPKCGSGRVTLISTGDDPEWSFAAITAGDGKSKLRRVGDDVDGHELFHLSWDRVWLLKDGARCQLVVGDAAAAKKAAPKKPKAAKGRRKKASRATALSAELAAKIHKVSDTEFNVERAVVDAVLEKQAELMRYTRIKPVKEGDKVVGLRLSRVRPGTLLEVLGLKNGDQIQSINGFELTNPQRALEAYGRLRTAQKLSLAVTRGGAPMTIDFNIQ